MVETGQFFGQALGNLQTLEFGPERGSPHVPGIVVDRTRGRRLHMIQLFPDSRDQFFQRGEGTFNQPGFLRLVGLIGEVLPVLPAGVYGGHHRITGDARMGTGVRVIDREGLAAGPHRGQFIRGKILRLGGEDQIPDVGEGFPFTDSHIDLAGTGVHPYRPGLPHKIRIEMPFPNQVLDRVLDIGIGDHCPAPDRPGCKAFAAVLAPGNHPGDTPRAVLAGFGQDLAHQRALAQLNPVLLQLRRHLADKGVRPPFVDEDAPVHEI